MIMGTTTRLAAPEEIEYPESDGEPMAENTEQYDWIVLIKEGLEGVFRDDPNVFIAADLFWYPVERNNKIRRAPDVLVALGRPKGRRGAYLQWREGGIAPQVVFEILSPGNRGGEELAFKFAFYETYGVEEYYVYDPEFNTLEGWLRTEGTLRPIPVMNGWISPRLGIRFEQVDDQFRLYRPDGRPFVKVIELHRQAEADHRRADEQQQRADAEQQRADAEQQRADAERQRADAQRRQLEEQRRQLDAEQQRAEAERQRAEAEQQRADAQQRQLEEQRRQLDVERQRAERLAAQLKALGIEPEP
jgi:Uma2 family endonuclease